MPDAASVRVERTRDAQHGDFATNIALRLAKAARARPARARAGDRRGAAGQSRCVARAEIAGAGFINFLPGRGGAAARAARASTTRGDAYGRSSLGAGERVLVEFVSANPTGPLHVGHGRQAPTARALANLLGPTGYRGASRVLHQRCRPADGHPRGQRLAALPRGLRRGASVSRERLRGDYVRAIAAQLHAAGRRRRCGARSARCSANLPPDEPEAATRKSTSMP